MSKKISWFGFVAVSAAALAFMPVVHAKDWTSVNIATEGAYEPWNLTLPGGKIGGFEPELMDILCQRMKLKCNVVVQNWDGMIASLNSGKFDVLMDAIVITPERQQVMAFSIPYASTPASFVALDAKLLPGKTGQADGITLGTDAKKVRASVEDLRAALKGKIIGIASGTVYTPFIDEQFKDVATIREYSSSAEAILDLQAGRIDVDFDDVTFLNSLMDKPENKNLAYTGPQIAGPIWGDGEALGFRQKDADLKAQFDAALKEALADGTVKKLSEKWFKLDLTPKS
ncbi:transporter substrate-binding domain-containing protein [Pseudomonas sp. CCI3.2]|uniref:transporter substrate-binding domain-containing protein n=1 Tax=unclassified Pseudomonas TaxID=196821 RepID=UPI002AC9DE6A|nr:MULTISPECIES: transporter substrate-binding domain-containing protein [unclassified Pseudomonas]MEB0080094.1 transporter substrate-binding domain-containing protein [Pseudomonas sp. MH10out]MEB0094036.1 transporter substrate-binding domain-containing protein [Pseudomonas sp. CCI4.2]MEB0103942.1 transporter substrate-binding domain-containing protein [Pseudomonas sp. CCI3.2]MEB0133186.1 transporter substrate-binding domain-containing protein [Pseudomonas sp. CCI2.4]MEB0160322.1 transporter s